MIYFDSAIPFVYNAGIRKYFNEVISAFIKIRHNEHIFKDAVIVTPGLYEDICNIEPNENIDIKVLGYPPKIPFLHRLIYYEILFSKSVIPKSNDLLFSPYFQLPLKFKGPNIISTVHDMLYYDMKHLYGSFHEAPYISYYNNCLKNAINNNHTIFTVSRYSKSRILNYFDIDETRIKSFYNLLSGEFYKNLIKENSDEYTGNSEFVKTTFKGRPYVFYTAGWEKRKNIRMLLSSLSLLSRNVLKEFRFVFTGITKKKLSEVLAYNNIKADFIKSCITTERVSLEDLAFLYQNATFTINLSSYEGFGFPVLESLLAGKNLVCSNIEAFQEVASDMAFYVDHNNYDSIETGVKAVLASLNDTQGSDRILKKYAIEFVERKSIENLKVVKEVFFG